MVTSRPSLLKELRLAGLGPRPASALRPQQRRSRGQFLRGPTPWVWLSRAGQLPGRALHVALAIRLWTGIKKTDCIVMPTATLTKMNVSRHATRRAVQALEAAGLLVADRHIGRKTRVRVVEVDDGSSDETTLK